MKSRISILGALAVRQRLHRFAIAAVIAVGLLALAWPAAAQIVYTPTSITIGPNASYNLDVNNDGVTDFTILAFSGNSGPPFYCYFASFGETPASENGVIVTRKGPARLKEGDEIGPSQTFSVSAGSMGMVQACRLEQPSGRGNWVSRSGGSKKGYLGLSFQVNGETYYGWAELSVHSLDGTASLEGYAYESTPGMPINAGQTQ